MKRIQLSPEEDARNTLHTIVRRALRQQYVAGSAQRQRAMEAFIGIRRNRPEFAHSERYIRGLRRDSRLQRVRGK